MSNRVSAGNTATRSWTYSGSSTATVSRNVPSATRNVPTGRNGRGHVAGRPDCRPMRSRPALWWVPYRSGGPCSCTGLLGHGSARTRVTIIAASTVDLFLVPGAGGVCAVLRLLVGGGRGRIGVGVQSVAALAQRQDQACPPRQTQQVRYPSAPC